MSEFLQQSKPLCMLFDPNRKAGTINVARNHDIRNSGQMIQIHTLTSVVYFYVAIFLNTSFDGINYNIRRNSKVFVQCISGR